MGVEIVPVFMDEDLCEFACRTPDSVIHGNRELKYLLRRAAAPYLPEVIRNRYTRPHFGSVEERYPELLQRRLQSVLPSLIRAQWLDPSVDVRALPASIRARLCYLGYWLVRHG